jgi:hypothetical protein
VTDPSTPDAPAAPHDDAGQEAEDRPSPLVVALAGLMLVLPLAGLAWHAVVYLYFDDEAVSAYLRGNLLKVSVFVAFANLIGNWLHYRRTRMKVDLASRILTYVWVISMILLFRRVALW